MLAALAVRLYRADAQSLWYDEGTSAALAVRPTGDILTAAAHDIHPPLYYLVLSIWVRLLGDGVVALRALSAVAGAATVLGVLAIGRRLWGTPHALAAGLLAAASPYLIWYGQEVRMYAPVAAVGTGLVWLTLRRVEAAAWIGPPAAAPSAARSPVRAANESTRRHALAAWAPWTMFATAALYTHYFAGASALAVADGVVLWALLSARRGRRALRWTAAAPWLVANGVAMVLFMPWLAFAWPAIRDWPALGPPLGPATIAARGLATFALGTATPDGSTGVAALLLAAAVGVAVRGRDGTRWAPAVAATWVAAPLALMAILALIRPAWNPKFLVVGAPGFELLAGAGVVGMAWAAARRIARGRPARPAGVGHDDPAGAVVAARAAAAVAALALAVLLAPRAAALRAMYFDPAAQRDDYRGIAERIAREAGPEDAVVLNAPTQVEVFGYYDRGRHAAYPLPIGRPADPAATLADLGSIASAHRDLYAVLWATGESDPDGIVEGWLNANRYKVFDAWYGNVRLALWAARRAPMASTSTWNGMGTAFGGRGAGAPEIGLAALRGGPSVAKPGEILTFEADWDVLAPPRGDYVVFMQLLDGAGRLAAQRDMAPLGGTARTSAWRPVDGPASEGIVDRIGFHVPADLAPGGYTLIMGLFDPATGERVPIVDPAGDGGAYVELGRVTLAGPE